MLHQIDLDALAAVRGGEGVNTERTTTNGSDVSIRRSNMGACLDDVARRCQSDPNNTWMFGLLTDQQRVGQCKAERAPVQCFDDPAAATSPP
jgi:hypothetical protein